MMKRKINNPILLSLSIVVSVFFSTHFFATDIARANNDTAFEHCKSVYSREMGGNYKDRVCRGVLDFETRYLSRNLSLGLSEHEIPKTISETDDGPSAFNTIDNYILHKAGPENVIRGVANELIKDFDVLTCYSNTPSSNFYLVWDFNQGRCIQYPKNQKISDSQYETNICTNLYKQKVQKTIEESLSSSNNTLYTKCLDHIKKISEIAIPKDEEKDDDKQIEKCIKPERTSRTLELQDFEHMRLFAKYASTVLESCTKDKKTHCNSFTEDEKKRLATIVGLTAVGSYPTQTISGVNGASISKMPESHELLPVVGEKKCELFSDLSGILKGYAGEFSAIKNCRFTPDNSPGCGAANLINSCKSDTCSDISTCQRIIGLTDKRALLSDYKIRPIFLQTLYWNVKDNSTYVNSLANFIYWEPLSEEQIAKMREVIANPDVSSTRKCTIVKEEDKASTPNNEFVCKVDGGTGWALCGITDLLLKGFDSAYKSLTEVLKIDKLIDQGGLGEIYKVWRKIADLANIIAVLFFAFVIFSQVTGVGMSNYGIKVALPKIFVTIILVNLSFFGLSLLIDISNISGSYIYNSIINITSLKNDSDLVGTSIMQQNWQNNFINNALDAITLILIGILWSIAIVLQLIISTLRDAILIAMVVVSPFVLALRLFPNTEKAVGWWSKAITFALIFYPINAFVFAISRVSFLISYNINNKSMMEFIMSRTVLIIPLFISPWLITKIGKFVPLINNLTSRLANWRDGVIAGRPAKEGSFRDWRQKSKRAAVQAANAGLYRGWRPVQFLKSEFMKATGIANSPIMATTNQAYIKELAEKRQQWGQRMTNKEAEDILNSYGASSLGGGGGAGASGGGGGGLPKTGLTASMKSNQATDKDMILSAAFALLNNSKEQNQTANIQAFAEALSLAKTHGASQQELELAHKQALEIFKGSNNFAATAELKFLESYYKDHPDANGDTWGIYDASSWSNPPAGTAPNAFQTGRKDAIRSELRHQVLESPLDSTLNKKVLEASYMPEGSVAREVFVEEFANNTEFESAIREQSGSFSAETFNSIDTSMNGGLSYNALTANLDASDFAKLEDYNQGRLSPDDITELKKRIARIKGTHNSNASTDPTKVDLGEIYRQTKRLSGPLDPNKYPDLIGWSFGNVVIDIEHQELPKISIKELQKQKQAQAQARREYMDAHDPSRSNRKGKKGEFIPPQNTRPADMGRPIANPRTRPARGALPKGRR